MAWNPSPEVAVARDVANKLGADRVVIVYTNEKGQMGYASYGKTKALCDATGKLAESLFKRAEMWFETGDENYDDDPHCDRTGFDGK